jgi:anti-anti-sigma regulatory factor
MVGESGVPVIRQRLSQDGELNLDELMGPGGHGRSALLSMADVGLVDSRRIGWLMAAHKRFGEEGGKLVLYSVRLRARETLAFLRLDRVLHIAEDEAAAAALLGAHAPSLSTG